VGSFVRARSGGASSTASRTEMNGTLMLSITPLLGSLSSLPHCTHSNAEK
jgi:hypothetical protein